MERSGDEEQVVFGNELNPVITTGAPATPNPSDESLPGSSVRLVTGTFQILCGAIEITLGIVVICVPLQKIMITYRYSGYWYGPYGLLHKYSYVYDYDETDEIGWGIWNGLFAIVTGYLGLCSRKTKCVIIAYMVTSIIATLSSVSCFIWAALYIPRANEDSGSYANDNRSASFAIYITLCSVFAVQMIMSILGASFTCGALSSTNIQHPEPVVYYCIAQPLHQQPGSILFSNQPSAPPPQYDAPCNSANQSTDPNWDKIKPSS